MSMDKKRDDETWAEYENRRIREDPALLRNHPFVPGDTRWCHYWEISERTIAIGTLTFRSQCGWSKECHPS